LGVGPERLTPNKASCFERIPGGDATLHTDAHALSGGNGDRKKEEADSHIIVAAGPDMRCYRIVSGNQVGYYPTASEWAYKTTTYSLRPRMGVFNYTRTAIIPSWGRHFEREWKKRREDCQTEPQGRAGSLWMASRTAMIKLPSFIPAN
jgi:hypothetical protein